MRTALTALCLTTLLAVAYLSASLIALRPPRANLPVWFALATVVVIQGALTLTALRPGLAARISPAPIRCAVLAGGAVLAAAGGWMVRSTLTSAHFEGYALVLGSMLVVQGALTLGAFLRGGHIKTA